MAKRADAATGYKKAQSRIAKEKRDGTMVLSLGGLGLTTLPPEIGSLTALRTLFLNNNRLITPPPEIGSLTALRTLYLNNNRLITLPPEIGSLTALQTLHLHINQLTTLPPEIGSLTALQTLYLSGNELTTLPPEIGSLTALQTLQLHSNQLTTLPPEIGSLTALQTLQLHSNQLTTLPSEIGLLSTLQTLDLGNNQLATLPPEIGSLTALQSLYLHNNQFTTLPPEIGSVIALRELHLDNNQLTTLTPEIGSLTALQMLDLSKNQLTTLPLDIRKLERSLTALYLHDNPGLGLISEELGPTWLEVQHRVLKPKPPAEILAYYFSHRDAAREEGTEPLMEAKVLVLGEASVGKTCLIAALTENKKRAEVPDGGTSGIFRKFWPVKVTGNTIAAQPSPADAQTLRLNCWDFGGQEIYHSAHTLFLTERAIYLVVISKRDNEKQNNIDQWLKMAASFGGPDAVTYVVVNKSDEKVGHAPDEEALRRRYPHVRGFLYTSCDDLNGIPEARKNIVEEALRLKGVQVPIARTWLAMKRRLETMNEHTLSMKDWADMCEKEVKDEVAQQQLLRMCDLLGTVRYFPANKPDPNRNDPPELCETAILNPEWVTKGIYALFDDEALKNRGGILTRGQMADILKSRGYPVDQERIIEEVMRRFDLLYDSAEEANREHMLIPLMLPEKEKAFDWPKDGTLEFVYQYAVMPPGLMPAFIARVHRHLANNPKPWRNGCVLEIKDCRLRVIGDRELARVSISVTGPDAAKRDVLDEVRRIFDALHSAVRDLGEQELIPVPRYPKAPMLKYRHMRSLEWQGIKEFHAEGESPGEIIVVNVREALDGVRGDEGRKRDEQA